MSPVLVDVEGKESVFEVESFGGAGSPDVPTCFVQDTAREANMIKKSPVPIGSAFLYT